MEHLRLLLHMVLSMARTHTDATTTAAGVGEWQEDSGLGLYRAPEEGAGAGAGVGAAASVHPVSLEKKVSPGWVERCFLLAAAVVKRGSKVCVRCFPTGDGFRKHCVCPESRGGAQFGHAGGFRTPAPLGPGTDREPLQ